MTLIERADKMLDLTREYPNREGLVEGHMFIIDAFEKELIAVRNEAFEEAADMAKESEEACLLSGKNELACIASNIEEKLRAKAQEKNWEGVGFGSKQ